MLLCIGAPGGQLYKTDNPDNYASRQQGTQIAAEYWICTAALLLVGLLHCSAVHHPSLQNTQVKLQALSNQTPTSKGHRGVSGTLE